MKPTYEDLQQQLSALDAINRQLNEKVAELTAENMVMKQAIDQHRCGFVVCPSCSVEISSSTDDVCYVLDKTPATDAAIAEMRAQGVDLFAVDLGKVYQQLRPSSTQAKALKSVIYRAQVFIGDLRAEASK